MTRYFNKGYSGGVGYVHDVRRDTIMPNTLLILRSVNAGNMITDFMNTVNIQVIAVVT